MKAPNSNIQHHFPTAKRFGTWSSKSPEAFMSRMKANYFTPAWSLKLDNSLDVGAWNLDVERCNDAML
jgi:hypothetical protein